MNTVTNNIKALSNTYNNLDNTQKEIVKSVAMFAVSAVLRKKMYDKGMVKSFWFGLPRKPHTYR